MPAYTKAEAEAELIEWKAALAAARSHQAYTMPNGREIRFRDLKEIRDMINYFSNIVDRAARSNRVPIHNVIPIDT